MNLLKNIFDNLIFLKQDFIGFTPPINELFTFFSNAFLSLILIVTFYLFGSKLKRFFPKNIDDNIETIISIALGFIVICTGILILGMLNLLYVNILYFYYFLILLISFIPINNLPNKLKNLIGLMKTTKKILAKNRVITFLLLCFVLMNFFRLVIPETGVDAVWYHNDYPKLYLQNHSMMTINPKGKFYPEVTPTLSDMMYVFAQSINNKDLSRYIHFSFYILSLIIIIAIYNKKFKSSLIAALLVSSSPIIIRVASSAYAEFPWLFCWLMAVYLITNKDKLKYKDLILPAILFGTTLAVKLWMIPFYGVFFIYILIINFKFRKLGVLKDLLLFSLLTLSVPFLWYLRAFIITGNPLFPTFWNYPDGSPNNPFSLSSIFSTFNLDGIKNRLLSAKNVSPLSIFGLFYLLSLLKIKKRKLKINGFIIFVLILTSMQVIINYSFHRFVIPFFSIFAIILSLGIEKFINFNKLFKYLFITITIFYFLYYFLNTILTLPYGLGWANKNNYLTRILSRDNLSYYNFNNQFNKYLNKNENVATYGLWGFYYADFKFTYIEELFRKHPKSLQSIKNNGSRKILILGGNIDWFCKVENIKNCSSDQYKLLAFYKFPTTASSQYLYEIK